MPTIEIPAQRIDIPEAPSVAQHEALQRAVADTREALQATQQAVARADAAIARLPQPATIASRVHGMAIGNKAYDQPAWQQQIARCASATIGFYPGWKGDSAGERMRAAVQAIKALNPGIRLAQYTILNEAVDDGPTNASGDKARKLDEAGWWLRNAAGARVQWTAEYKAWDINFTGWTRADAAGLRWPQWLARRDAATYFDRVPEFDMWYLDNVMRISRIKQADWRGDGVDASAADASMQAAHRLGHAAHWDEIRRLYPWLELIGNADGDLGQPEFTGRLDVAFLEGVAGKSWSIETKGWLPMWERYSRAQRNVRKHAVLHGFGAADDYATLRYLLATALLGDGHFAFNTPAGYGALPWFDEFDQAIGEPVESPWELGAFRGRRYERGMVVVNTDRQAASTQPVPHGFRRFRGTQAPAVNNGEPVERLTLPPRDGLVLVRA